MSNRSVGHKEQPITLLQGVLNENQLPENEVRLSSVRQRLPAQNIASEVTSAIRDLIDSREYKYINAFFNTIKHLRLLNLNRRFEFTSSGSSTSRTLDIRLRSFAYNNDTCPDTDANQLVDDYRSRVVDLISDIGRSMSAYLR